MLTPSAAFSGLCVFSALLLSVSGEKAFEGRPGMIHELHTTLVDLAADVETYLGRLAGEPTVQSVLEASSQALYVMAGGLAGGLKVVLQYISHFLQAAGIKVSFPINTVTPDGLIFVAKWVLLALIGYWLFSLALQLVVSTVRRALWLLKVIIALACFVLILRDHGVGTETMAIRLAVLVFCCVLLGIRTSKASNAADKTAHLEEQVKILERRLREMEKWRRTEE